jgi:predicted exporter
MSSRLDQPSLSREAAAQNREEAQLESWLGAGDRRALEVVQAHAAVSQSAFDEAVLSNMEEFEMSMQDAIQDAKATFHMQGRTLPQGMRYGAEHTEEHTEEHAERAHAERQGAEKESLR